MEIVGNLLKAFISAIRIAKGNIVNVNVLRQEQFENRLFKLQKALKKINQNSQDKIFEATQLDEKKLLELFAFCQSKWSDFFNSDTSQAKAMLSKDPQLQAVIDLFIEINPIAVQLFHEELGSLYANSVLSIDETISILVKDEYEQDVLKKLTQKIQAYDSWKMQDAIVAFVKNLQYALNSPFFRIYKTELNKIATLGVTEAGVKQNLWQVFYICQSLLCLAAAFPPKSFYGELGIKIKSCMEKWLLAIDDKVDANLFFLQLIRVETLSVSLFKLSPQPLGAFVRSVIIAATEELLVAEKKYNYQRIIRDYLVQLKMKHVSFLLTDIQQKEFFGGLIKQVTLPLFEKIIALKPELTSKQGEVLQYVIDLLDDLMQGFVMAEVETLAFITEIFDFLLLIQPFYTPHILLALVSIFQRIANEKAESISSGFSFYTQKIQEAILKNRYQLTPKAALIFLYASLKFHKRKVDDQAIDKYPLKLMATYVKWNVGQLQSVSMFAGGQSVLKLIVEHLNYFAALGLNTYIDFYATNNEEKPVSVIVPANAVSTVTHAIAINSNEYQETLKHLVHVLQEIFKSGLKFFMDMNKLAEGLLAHQHSLPRQEHQGCIALKTLAEACQVFVDSYLFSDFILPTTRNVQFELAIDGDVIKLFYGDEESLRLNKETFEKITRKIRDIFCSDSFRKQFDVISTIKNEQNNLVSYMQNADVASYFKKNEKSFTDEVLANGDLNQILIQPLQRLQKYPLLLEELLKDARKLLDANSRSVMRLEATKNFVAMSCAICNDSSAITALPHGSIKNLLTVLPYSLQEDTNSLLLIGVHLASMGQCFENYLNAHISSHVLFSLTNTLQAYLHEKQITDVAVSNYLSLNVNDANNYSEGIYRALNFLKLLSLLVDIKVINKIKIESFILFALLFYKYTNNPFGIGELRFNVFKAFQSENADLIDLEKHTLFEYFYPQATAVEKVAFEMQAEIMGKTLVTFQSIEQLKIMLNEITNRLGLLIVKPKNIAYAESSKTSSSPRDKSSAETNFFSSYSAAEPVASSSKPSILTLNIS